jgi:ribokinase
MVDVVASGTGHGAHIRLRPGGSAFNAACWAAAGEAESSVVGRVGDDAAGRMVVAELAARGVRTEIGVDPDAPTGTFLLVEGSIRADRGANARFRPEHVPALHADAVLVSGYLPPDTVASALERADAPWVALDAGRLSDLPAGADVVLANEQAARRLTGAEPDDAARRLAEGCRVACVTLGARGAVAASADGVERAAAPGASGGDVSGAGDAFAAALLLALARSASVSEALAEACRAGAAAAGKV